MRSVIITQDRLYIVAAIGPTVRIYFISGKLYLEKQMHSPVTVLTVSPDRRMFASGDEDGFVKIFSFSTGGILYDWLHSLTLSPRCAATQISSGLEHPWSGLEPDDCLQCCSGWEYHGSPTIRGDVRQTFCLSFSSVHTCMHLQQD